MRVVISNQFSGEVSCLTGVSKEDYLLRDVDTLMSFCSRHCTLSENSMGVTIHRKMQEEPAVQNDNNHSNMNTWLFKVLPFVTKATGHF